MASEQSSLEPALQKMIPVTSSSGLVPDPTPSTPFVPPTRNDWDILFRPLFDEFFTPRDVETSSPEVIAPAPEAIPPAPVVSIGTSSSTTVEQNGPTPSNSQTTLEI